MAAARVRAVVVSAVVIAGTASCAAAKPKVVVSPRAEPELQSSFKRVDYWQYVDLELPLTRVELQLKKHFEQTHGRAQYSAAHTCVARELANFYEKYGWLPEESLTMMIHGRCGMHSSAHYSLHEIISDGTLLETGFSSEQLGQIDAVLVDAVPAFSAFGITARYRGANALIMLSTAKSEVSMQLTPATESGEVRLEGMLLEAILPRAVINQGALGYEECTADEQAVPPRYAFTCQMAPGDDEAWVSLQGTLPDGSYASLGLLPAHRPDWKPPAEFRWAPPSLPEQVDTPTALLTRINEWRSELGRSPLEYAAAQSASTEAIYEQVFRINATGDWNGDAALLGELLRGRNLGVPILGADLVGGIAHDGDAADWLAYRILDPRSRETLMSPAVDVASVTVHGHPKVGFGAAVVTFALLTPEKLVSFAETIAERIDTYRERKESELLDNPEELERAAEEIAAEGLDPNETFAAALRQLNVGSVEAQHYEGVIFELGGLSEAADLPAALAEPPVLSYGVLPTFQVDEQSGEARPLCFVWYLTRAPQQKLASATSSSR